MEKHSESRLSYLFAHLPLLSSDLFSSDSFHLCFSTVHIVESFTSKLPSIIALIIYFIMFYHVFCHLHFLIIFFIIFFFIFSFFHVCFHFLFFHLFFMCFSFFMFFSFFHFFHFIRVFLQCSFHLKVFPILLQPFVSFDVLLIPVLLRALLFLH